MRVVLERVAVTLGASWANALTENIATKNTRGTKHFSWRSKEAFVSFVPSWRSFRSSAFQQAIHFRPVHHVPPRPKIIGPAVLVFQVVGVLPHIDAEDRLLAFHQRVVLVRRTGDFELAAVVNHPRPAAAKARRSRLVD